MSNLNEILFELATLDLPFIEESHGLRSERGRKVEIKAASNLLMFTKQIGQTAKSVNTNLLILHRYLENGTEKEVPLTDFLINQPYSCQVILTNISSTELTFQALTQIPAGSIPINTSTYQKSHLLTVAPFTTTKVMIHFIFPRIGTYEHFPTQASIDEEVVASA